MQDKANITFHPGVDCNIVTCMWGEGLDSGGSQCGDSGVPQSLTVPWAILVSVHPPLGHSPGVLLDTSREKNSLMKIIQFGHGWILRINDRPRVLLREKE